MEWPSQVVFAHDSFFGLGEKTLESANLFQYFPMIAAAEGTRMG